VGHLEVQPKDELLDLHWRDGGGRCNWPGCKLGWKWVLRGRVRLGPWRASWRTERGELLVKGRVCGMVSERGCRMRDDWIVERLA
jgi:hypothetical protein